MGVEHKNTDSFSPRSFSSDEAEKLNPPVVVIPKPAFAEVLKEGYQRCAQERAEWLKGLSASPEDPPVFKVDPTVCGTGAKQESGFNATRRPLSVLRDPDIVDEVRKWNVQMKRDEVPHARPLRCER